MAECELLRLLGLPVWMCEIWSAAHVFSIVQDRTNGIRMEINNQRRSGDPWTYPGKTLTLLMLLCSVFDLRDMNLFLASGDDSCMVLNTGVREDVSSY